MPFAYDHIHIRSRDPEGTVKYYHDVFGAKPVESVQSDGQPRVDLDLDGLTIFIAKVAPDAEISAVPADPYLGLDHFGLRVDNLDETSAELKKRGATFTMEPRTIRPGVKIAFVLAPDNVRIELLERT